MVKQVGGTHYENKYQHWDWATDAGIGYLDGTATKYIVRWRKKNGLQDLQKALSYVEKMVETVDVPQCHTRRLDIIDLTMQMCQCYDLTLTEARIVLALATWETLEDVQIAAELLRLFIEEMDTVEALERVEAALVPLTEENHYAERASPPPPPVTASRMRKNDNLGKS